MTKKVMNRISWQQAWLTRTDTYRGHTMLFDWTLLAIVAGLSIWQWRSLTGSEPSFDQVDFSPEARQIMAREDRHIRPGFDVLAIVCFAIFVAGLASGIMWREIIGLIVQLVK